MSMLFCIETYHSVLMCGLLGGIYTSAQLDTRSTPVTRGSVGEQM